MARRTKKTKARAPAKKRKTTKIPRPKSKRPPRVGKKGAPAELPDPAPSPSASTTTPSSKTEPDGITAKLLLQKTGRPTLLSPALAEAVVTTMLEGNYVETAAAMHGIAKSTLYRWMREGARLARMDVEDRKRALGREALTEEEELLIAFSAAIKSARATAEGQLVAAVRLAGEWQALAWLLERMFPDRYARRQVIKVGATTADDERSDFNPANLSTEDLEELDRLMTKATAQEAVAEE